MFPVQMFRALQKWEVLNVGMVYIFTFTIQCQCKMLTAVGNRVMCRLKLSLCSVTLQQCACALTTGKSLYCTLWPFQFSSQLFFYVLHVVAPYLAKLFTFSGLKSFWSCHQKLLFTELACLYFVMELVQRFHSFCSNSCNTKRKMPSCNTWLDFLAFKLLQSKFGIFCYYKLPLWAGGKIFEGRKGIDGQCERK